MPPVGFEPMIPVFELATTFHVIDRAATMIRLFMKTFSTNYWIFTALLEEINNLFWGHV
jgi:hypothetical protein